MQQNLNKAVSAYCMVPHCATGFSPSVLLYGGEAVTPYAVPFTRYTFEVQHQDTLSSHTKKMFKNHKGAFFSNHKFQLKMKKTFDLKKVGKKEVTKFQVGELLWLYVQRRIPDMKYNKAKGSNHSRLFLCQGGVCLSCHTR